MIVTIGTNDTLASPGAQLDYYQSVLDRMGRGTVDRFARLLRDAADRTRAERHQLRRRTAMGGRFRRVPIPNRYDQLGLLFDWVENRRRARHVGDCHRRREEPAALFVSVVSAIPGGGLCLREFLRMRVYAGKMKPGSSSVGADDEAESLVSLWTC